MLFKDYTGREYGFGQECIKEAVFSKGDIGSTWKLKREVCRGLRRCMLKLDLECHGYLLCANIRWQITNAVVSAAYLAARSAQRSNSLRI